MSMTYRHLRRKKGQGLPGQRYRELSKTSDLARDVRNGALGELLFERIASARQDWLNRFQDVAAHGASLARRGPVQRKELGVLDRSIDIEEANVLRTFGQQGTAARTQLRAGEAGFTKA